MRVLEPGHKYECAHLNVDSNETLTFIRRNSDAITHASEHPGTTTQEVLRALIDRTKFVDDVLPCEETALALDALREALFFFEARAFRRKRAKLNKTAIPHDAASDYGDVPFTCDEIEFLPVNPEDGHIKTHEGLE